MVYVVSIHPFQDGNGRLSRTIMAYRMARNGLIAVICGPRLQREGCIAMIQAANKGMPDALCEEVIKAQIELLRRKQ